MESEPAGCGGGHRAGALQEPRSLSHSGLPTPWAEFAWGAPGAANLLSPSGTLTSHTARSPSTSGATVKALRPVFSGQ